MIPKSLKEENIKGNADLFDFELSAPQFHELKSLASEIPGGHRFGFNPELVP